MATTSTSLARLAQELHKPEAEIMTMAFEAGLRQLAVDVVHELRRSRERGEQLLADVFELVDADGIDVRQPVELLLGVGRAGRDGGDEENLDCAERFHLVLALC